MCLYLLVNSAIGTDSPHHLMLNHFIKQIAPDFIRAIVLHLNQPAILDSTQRDVERASTPVEHQCELAIIPAQIVCQVPMRSKMGIERGERLVDKLNDSDACLSECI